MQRAIRGELVTNQIMDIIRPDGQVVTVLSNASPLFNEAGRSTRRGWCFSGHHGAQTGRRIVKKEPKPASGVH